MSNTVSVGIADLNVVRSPDTLVTFALGSCVGICLFDPNVKAAGLSHILLPNSAQIPGNNTPMKFADTAIPMLVKKMEALGANPSRMKAKIAGGAQMFASMSNASIANIGARNVEAVKATLQRLRIPIITADTGENYGRTLYFNADDFMMTIRSPKRGVWTG
ncbi:chemotaxis protein CheD [Ruminococcaceae bacterium OttesenSCG-928-I18]|nr:chemotaxis protein CheD [Ruminococcaceae bacterium OttesenSCG-928-I18]